MTNESLMKQHEKSPLASKKFVGYLIAEFTWKIILLVMLLVFKDQLAEANFWAWVCMIVIVLVAGFVEVVTIGKQADLDKFVRLAHIAASIPGAKIPNPNDKNPKIPGSDNPETEPEG